ncbi:Hpt domain-containing protein [Aestuariivita sp.]|jgi:HPt (histidine-containing phosphotransfer) domain-containing protein|uniref:Hpt domain-containing protein n=1 Tax=Aestuariivita sp. TaxID=1872407 RepID=UPI002171494C|nr:Hpt domain-containing protein [Aestuariivita sp.]MCE8006791.1 hypothetical protein [Aestuariivita sp.]|eukprot:TRINITY_DN29835_c0_g1_i1.p3 TRINITY_DN29835_c0_g1~~TRINITY_DN29835_c0_g1_i1.p3  ORF type:complete len:110 (-),score=8.99 TRINITY_DN29835_c0_g1_i1:487-816(-)
MQCQVTPRASVENALVELRNRFRGTLEERIITMERATIALDSDPECAEAAEIVRRECHKLSGIASSLGFDQIGAQATEIDMAFAGNTAIWTQVRPMVNDLLDKLECELD